MQDVDVYFFLLLCALPKAGSVDNDAIRPGVQLFSLAPGNWSSCSISKSNIFLLGFRHVRFRHFLL